MNFDQIRINVFMNLNQNFKTLIIFLILLFQTCKLEFANYAESETWPEDQADMVLS